MNVLNVGVAHGAVLAELHKEGFATPWTAETFVDMLSTPGTFAVLVEDEQQAPQGFVLIRSGGGEAEILTIVTRSKARRQGVGKTLMLAVLEKLKGGDAKKLFLEVATDNQKAYGLYTALGFAEIGQRKGYYARGEGLRVDAVVMALNLL